MTMEGIFGLNFIFYLVIPLNLKFNQIIGHRKHPPRRFFSNSCKVYFGWKNKAVFHEFLPLEMLSSD